MKRGFTLLEVVVALLVLEVAVVGVVGALVLASSTLTRAEVLERAAAEAEGVLDSLARTRGPRADSSGRPWGALVWIVDDSARVHVRATDPNGAVVLDVRSVLPGW
ncbi:MAG: prepilin-type N-terminal cleavage/methylation domain-containing protein [Longimicrobiales bacterium]